MPTNLKTAAFTLAFLVAVPSLAAPPAQDLASRRKALADLFAERWQYNLRTSPEWASMLGDKRYDDRLSELSQRAIDDDLAATRDFLTRLRAIDAAGFPDDEITSRDILERDLADGLEGARWKPWQTPMSQMYGPHLELPQLAGMLDFSTEADLEHWIARLGQVPRLFGEVETHMRAGMADKNVLPRVLVGPIADQLDGMAKMKPADSPFAAPLAKLPPSLAAARKEALRGKLLSVIEKQVLPAYRKLGEFVRKEYLPHARDTVGEWALPDGEARYAYDVRTKTTTHMTPEEVHQLGLAEVARIEKEMLAIARAHGHSDLRSFTVALDGDPKVHPTSAEDLLDRYRRFTDRMWKELPKLFGRLPSAKPEVVAIEAFRAKNAPFAQYQEASDDGKRPGRIQINTYDWAHRKTLDVETTAYHEGIPGHHLQIAVAQEQKSLPDFRRHSFFIAFVEGWALYAERIAEELGFYEDPYSRFGHLGDEMVRAIRLVVDTGLHYKRWTRQQVVDFFHQHYASDELMVQTETDRYISWPGQALGYKVGQLTFLRLRSEAEKALGKRFDVRAFHDLLVDQGAMPLDIVEKRVHAWMASQKAAR